MQHFTVSLLVHIAIIASIAYSKSGRETSWSEVSVIAIDSIEQKNASVGTRSKFKKKAPVTNSIDKKFTDHSPEVKNENPQVSGDDSANAVTDLNSSEVSGVATAFSQLVSLIYKNKIYPYESVRLRQQGQVKITFEIDESGQITGIQVLNPSQHRLLNQAAVQSIKKINLENHISQLKSLCNRKYTFTFDFEISTTARI